MTTTPHPPVPKAAPSQPAPQPQRDVPPAYARVAGSFKTDTWQVGLGAGWRS